MNKLIFKYLHSVMGSPFFTGSLRWVESCYHKDNTLSNRIYDKWSDDKLTIDRIGQDRFKLTTDDGFIVVVAQWGWIETWYNKNGARYQARPYYDKSDNKYFLNNRMMFVFEGMITKWYVDNQPADNFYDFQ